MALPPSRLSSTIRFRPEAGKSASFQFIKNFRPEDVGNITLWLDASEYSTLTFKVGNQLLSWQDKKIPQSLFVLNSTNSPTYNATGFNGLPTVRFTSQTGLKNSDGAPYTLTANDALTIFVIGSLDSSPSQKNIMFRAGKLFGGTPVPLDIGADPNPDPSYTPPPPPNWQWFGNFDVTYTNSANDQTNQNVNPTVVCFVVPAGASNEKLFTNANPAFSQSASTRGGSFSLNVSWDRIFIGTDGLPGIMENYWDGSISEIIVYDNALSDTDITKVSAYLGQKWGFKDSLTAPYNSEQVYRPVQSGPSVYMKQFTG